VKEKKNGTAWSGFLVFPTTTFTGDLAASSLPFSPRQGTLMTMAVGAFAISFNVFATKHLPVFDVIILVMFIIGFFVIIIPLWVLAPRASVGDVFGKFENFGGWSTMGGACIVGQMAASAAFIVSCSEGGTIVGVSC
jgi:choline transport protein